MAVHGPQYTIVKVIRLPVFASITNLMPIETWSVSSWGWGRLNDMDPWPTWRAQGRALVSSFGMAEHARVHFYALWCCCIHAPNKV